MRADYLPHFIGKVLNVLFFNMLINLRSSAAWLNFGPTAASREKSPDPNLAADEPKNIADDPY